MKKNIVITGAGSGLGKMAATELSKRGHFVFALTKLENEAEDLNKIAIKNSLSLKSFKLDILLEEDRKKLKNIDFDILINNAAIGDSGSVSELNIDRFKAVFETNVFSSIEVSQLAIEKMVQKKQGRIIFISSLAGKISIPFLCPYCSSKFAIESIAESLRFEMKLLKNTNIEIGLIEPGAFATGFNKENNEKKYNFMKEKSYFKNDLEKIRSFEDKIWKIIEKKNFDSVIKQYIKVVECKKLKLRYSVPKSQALFVNFLRILGF